MRGESSWRTLEGSICCCCCGGGGGGEEEEEEAWARCCWTAAAAAAGRCSGGSGTKLMEEGFELRSSSQVRVAPGQRVLGTLPLRGVAMVRIARGDRAPLPFPRSSNEDELVKKKEE